MPALSTHFAHALSLELIHSRSNTTKAFLVAQVRHKEKKEL